MSIPISSATSMLSSLKRLREHTQSMHRVPGAQPVATAITTALDAIEDIVNGRDTTGSQRLKEALVGVMMSVTALLPTWWQDISDRDKKQLGMPSHDNRIPTDRTDMVNMVNRILRPTEAYPSTPTDSPPSSATATPARHPSRPLPHMPPPPIDTPPATSQRDPSAPLSSVRQQVGDQVGSTVSGSISGTDLIIRRLKRLLAHYGPGLDQGLDHTQSPQTIITALKRILKSQQAKSIHTQDAHHAEQLNRLFDQLNDGIEDIAELEGILKGINALGTVPPLLMDTLKGAVADWLAQECDQRSPQDIQVLIATVNTLAQQTIGQDLISNQDTLPSDGTEDPDHRSTDPATPQPISLSPVTMPMGILAPSPVPMGQPKANVFHESHQDTPLQRAALLIASITQCITHHALQIAEDAFEPLLKNRQKNTPSNPIPDRSLS